MNKDEIDAVTLVAEMKRQNLTVKEAVKAMRMYADDKNFQEELDRHYNNDLLMDDDWDNWYPDNTL